MRKLVEIPYEMVDQIVVDEIKQALEIATTINRDEGGHICEPDLGLIDALKITLRYFAARSDYEPFLRNLALQEMAMHNELLGLYDEQLETTPQQ